MALSETEKFQIRWRLGWSERFFQTDSRLDQALSAIDTRPDAEAQLQVHLASLIQFDTEITQARGRLKANQVGSIQLNRAELYELRQEAQRECNAIAQLLGVAVRRRFYGYDTPRDFASADGPGGGSWNYIGK
jgi:hypothetical protein